MRLPIARQDAVFFLLILSDFFTFRPFFASKLSRRRRRGSHFGI
jgi:hypothetical protein